MPSKRSNLGQFWREVKRRKIIRRAIWTTGMDIKAGFYPPVPRFRYLHYFILVL